MGMIQRLFVLYCDATLAFCTTAFLKKVVKMLKGSRRQITKLHGSPPEEDNLESVKSAGVKTLCHVSVTKKM